MAMSDFEKQRIDKGMEVLARDLQAKIKEAARTKVYARPETAQQRPTSVPKSIGLTDKIIFVGASTGGVEALLNLLLGFPEDCPPILITQHMPERFTSSFAARLNNVCAMKVVEAADQEVVQQGHVYIAPGSHHLENFATKPAGFQFRSFQAGSDTLVR